MIKIINERNQFRDDLNEEINNSFFCKNKGGCYLIEDSWDSELNQNFFKYDNYKEGDIYEDSEEDDENDESDNHEENDYKEFIPKKRPIFINNIESIIECIKNNTKLKLVNKKLIELIYGKNKLKDCRLIKYMAGNKALILQYINDDDNKAILFINPLNQNKIEERTFIISKKDKENHKGINYLVNLLKKDKFFDNYVMHFKAYLKFNELIIKKNKIEKEEIKDEGCGHFKGDLVSEKNNLNNKKELPNKENLINELMKMKI